MRAKNWARRPRHEDRRAEDLRRRQSAAALGGRYFLFLKLNTDDGVEGVGEVYAASFAPKAIVAMIEDVFERHVEAPTRSRSKRSGATSTGAAIRAGRTFR